MISEGKMVEEARALNGKHEHGSEVGRCWNSSGLPCSDNLDDVGAAEVICYYDDNKKYSGLLEE